MLELKVRVIHLYLLTGGDKYAGIKGKGRYT
jgi:hypothetical protein